MIISSAQNPLQTKSLAWRIAGLLFALITLSSPVSMAGGGVFIFQESSVHPESSSKAARYLSYKRDGEITTFRLQNAPPIRITKFQPLIILETIDPYSLASIRPSASPRYIQFLNIYRAAYNKYPNSRPLLKEQIEVLEDTVVKLRAGQAWFDGRWIADAEVDQTQTVKREEAVQKIRDRNKNEQQASINEQLVSLDKKIQELQQKLEPMKAKVSAATDHRARVDEKNKRVVNEANEIIRTMLKSES